MDIKTAFTALASFSKLPFHILGTVISSLCEQFGREPFWAEDEGPGTRGGGGWGEGGRKGEGSYVKYFVCVFVWLVCACPRVDRKAFCPSVRMEIDVVFVACNPH